MPLPFVIDNRTVRMDEVLSQVRLQDADLPFFSQLSLREARRALDRMRFPVYVDTISIH